MAFIDDHSRVLTGYRWGHSEDTLHLAAALRNGLAARGIPNVAYLDNGAAMISKQLMRALAILGIRLVHSRPGQPAGRGKIERVFRTVRDQFLIELAAPDALAKVDGLRGLNELFTAWVETVYHQRVHSETGQSPLARFTATDPPMLPSPAMLREAFLWSERRLVAKTATVSFHGNTYEVDAALVGRSVELVFDPFDLTCLSVRYQDRDMGAAVPHQIGRHVHPAAKPETGPDPAPVTGDRLPRPGPRPTRHHHAEPATSELRRPGLTHQRHRRSRQRHHRSQMRCRYRFGSRARLVRRTRPDQSHGQPKHG